jgi:hypothetical protein
MLIDKGDGTYTGGPLDALVILRNVATGRFHAAFLEERPMPGPVKPVDEVEVVRLASKMHHTAGADTVDGAREHLRDLALKIELPDGNVCEDPVDWDGRIAFAWPVRNWRAMGRPVGEVLGISEGGAPPRPGA